MSEHKSRSRLLDATLNVVKAKGYSAARVEDICSEAKLTKGSFFHHFKSKQDVALSAAALWGERTRTVFGGAAYHDLPDPADRLLAYVDLRKSMLKGELCDFTCFAGVVVQEAYLTNPELHAVCADVILGHGKTLEADITAALRRRGGRIGWTAESLARHIQAVVHGAFILAKATGGAQAASESLDHLRRYLTLLLAAPVSTRPRRPARPRDRRVRTKISEEASCKSRRSKSPSPTWPSLT